jgi:uncharacterized phiE125 gp8 family phage protein
MGLSVTSSTSVPAAMLSIAKEHMRVSGTTDDTLIGLYLDAAINDAETFTGVALFDTTYKLTLSDFPSSTEIVLPRSPAKSVTSVKYYDTDGNLQTLATAAYTVNVNDEQRGTITLNDDYDWPDVDEDDPEAVEIVFVAGHGTAYTTAPQLFIAGILLYAGHLYDNRDGGSTEDLTPVQDRFFHRFRANFY